MFHFSPLEKRAHFKAVDVSYKKLFKLLIDRNMKKKDLRIAAGLSPASISKLAKDEYVSMEVLVKVCHALHVDIGDIMEVLDD